MPRRDDFDEYDDASPRSSGTKTFFIVFGIIGGLFALAILSCVGVIGFGIFQMRTTMTSMLQRTTLSYTFIAHLKAGRNEQAYGLTSNAYRAKVSREQFNEEVNKHPLLAQHQSVTLSRSTWPDGQSKPATASIVMTLSDMLPESPDMMDDDDDDDFRPGAVEKIGSKVPPKQGKTRPPGKRKTLDLSLSMIEDNGNWVIDSWSVIRE